MKAPNENKVERTYVYKIADIWWELPEDGLISDMEEELPLEIDEFKVISTSSQKDVEQYELGDALEWTYDCYPEDFTFELVRIEEN